MSSSKSELTCNICKLVLNTPVTLPCSSVICGEHLRDDSVKNGMIKCMKCDKDFDVPRSGFPSNERVANILANDHYLNDEEKAIKNAIQELIQKLEQLQNVIKLKKNEMEVTSFDHFTEIRRHIDIQREELKKKIDEIALKLIDQANEREKVYKSKLKESISVIVDTDIKKFTQLLMREFRDPNLLVSNVKRLQIMHEENVKEFQARISDFDSLGKEIKLLEFKPTQEFEEIGLGSLRLKGSLIACPLDNIIQIWNINSSECVDSLEDNFASITCLENIDEHRFASGFLNGEIRIWDAKKFVCLKTLVSEKQFYVNNIRVGVKSLKSLTSKTLASDTYDEINIWNIERGECIQILIGHSDWINNIIYLPNGNLVSCSDDETINVWDLARGECIKTLKGHSSHVICIFLLRNGHLASGSLDETIKIWNMENGECVKTLQGHSYCVWQLEQLESGELVSCSADETIKLWDLTEGTCIKTLDGHTTPVTSIRFNSLNDTLVSCSGDGTIKIWNLKTGVCVNTIDVTNKYEQLTDFIFI